MLPKPQCTFTIPSLHDGLKLEGRLYFPRDLHDHPVVSIQGFAIFAHPYAPLGGSWDDPVVQTVGALLLQQGFVLSTFNFRGANGSRRSTSWTGKAELADYTSFFLLLLLLINAPEVVDYTISTEKVTMKPLLILGGYSYGSLIASHLPTLETVHKIFENADERSSPHEIQLRASEISKTLLGYLISQVHRGQATRQDPDTTDFPTYRRGLALGGYESEHSGRRISRESLRNSVDKFRHKSISRGSTQRISKTDSASTLRDLTIDPTLAYLLVSPLLPPISGITTMFVRLKFEHQNGAQQGELQDGSMDHEEIFTKNHTLAIYGDEDGFTSARKLRKWTHKLESLPESRFVSKEVENIGHFWTEEGAKFELCGSIQRWLDTLVRQNQ